MSQLLSARLAIRAQQIRPGEARDLEVLSGQLLQIVTLHGKQVSDFVAFARDDTTEFLSTAATRSINSSIMLQVGMKLYSNRRNPLFEIVEDTVGRHDLLFAACDPRRYKDDYGLDDHASCRAALTASLEHYGVGYDRVPDPVNWFMNVGILQRGELEIREPLAERNDYVLLEALMDTIVGISACPQDQNPVNGGNPTDILVRVYR